MPLIEDNGDGSQSVTPIALSDTEFAQLAPPAGRRAWGIFPTYYESVSGRGHLEGHDLTWHVVNFFGHVVDIGFMIIVAAAVFIVLICCFPSFAHLVF